ncbi:exopolyphosphatase/guanosine-5'-triphosphate,3'-diphosphate pyrophosphatase [Dyadobacter jejuensis]|uniref:Exopolyphosphatase/guanosine-5'-triphosphate, 3'-diphosphate pyrophosphatase n=1 Tax=Dyadobacter jejuensis TaxID=1082580 RepID=A0A316ARA4_9BACT|nr:phosphatase [Dyadobacter jejuensis]PWJ59350.1 exopolyphosphatase/guanosine-5'-triphosphate,3'-diphosphate pyrophosphatase [Dyadobacter jejuensis]
MKYAAIDIGSNGARMQISSILNDEGRVRFKKVEYVRFPLRLGHDVFTKGEISAVSEDRMIKLMLAYQLLMELHEVDDYMACSTSAMREAINGHEVRDNILQRTGIHIQIIDGKKEADLVNNVVVKSLGEGQFLHIDVGGGSTELNVYRDHQQITSKSFKLGSVRLLEGKESKGSWQKIEEWIRANVDYSQPIQAVGTGGNINKLFDLSSKLTESSTSLSEIIRMKEYISQFTLVERINKLQLNPDRADVIVPAGDIYTSAMKWAGAEIIHVPDVGLKDGMLQMLYDRAIAKKNKVK